MVDGIVPTNLFEFSHRYCMEDMVPIELGIEPVKQFPIKFNVFIFVTDINADGMVPPTQLPEIWNAVICRKALMEVGIEPTSPLSAMLMLVTIPAAQDTPVQGVLHTSMRANPSTHFQPVTTPSDRSISPIAPARSHITSSCLLRVGEAEGLEVGVAVDGLGEGRALGLGEGRELGCPLGC
jgi:hypothetical protein